MFGNQIFKHDIKTISKGITMRSTPIRAAMTMACAAFMTFAITAPVWGSHVVTKNIGFPKGKTPIPISELCLDPMEVFDTSTTVHIGSAVEPTLAVNPRRRNHVVAAWQQDRIDNGGALEVGIAYSRNGGLDWKRTTVPFQNCNRGFIQRVSDVWLSYSADGEKLYLATLLVNSTVDINTNNQSGVTVSISKDNGETWSNPRFVAGSEFTLSVPGTTFPVDDKTSITADRNDKDFAYAVWDRFPNYTSYHSDTYISRTTDGGISWTPHAVLYDPFLDPGLVSNGIENDNQTIDNVIVVLPLANSSESYSHSRDDSSNLSNGNILTQNGDILNFMTRIYATPSATDNDYTNDVFPYQFTKFDIALVRSTNNGANWSQTATVVSSFIDNPIFTGGYSYTNSGVITGGLGVLLRTSDLTPSYNVNPKNGYLYVVWQSGQFRNDQLSQIALSTSRDGGLTWSSPVKVSVTPPDSANPQAFNPFVAVNDVGEVGVFYYDFRKNKTLDSSSSVTNTDAWLAIYKEVADSTGGSTGVGLDFVKEKQITKHSFNVQNGPTTTQGVMATGDYSFLVGHGDAFYMAYTKSFDGPFTPPELYLNDLINDATVYVDDNYRQAPFFSRVR